MTMTLGATSLSCCLALIMPMTLSLSSTLMLSCYPSLSTEHDATLYLVLVATVLSHLHRVELHHRRHTIAPPHHPLL